MPLWGTLISNLARLDPAACGSSLQTQPAVRTRRRRGPPLPPSAPEAAPSAPRRLQNAGSEHPLALHFLFSPTSLAQDTRHHGGLAEPPGNRCSLSAHGHGNLQGFPRGSENEGEEQICSLFHASNFLKCCYHSWTPAFSPGGRHAAEFLICRK